MAMRIEDGQGTGAEAQVFPDKRLAVSSSSQNVSVVAAESGNAFVLSSGTISLTTPDVYHPLLYFKSLSDIHLHIGRVVYNVKYELVTCFAWFNATGGTIITNASPAPAMNTNLASGKQFSGVAYVGVDGDTVTGGIGPVITRYANAPLPIDLVDVFVLGRGNSVILGVNPSTAVDISISAIVYFSD